MINGTILQCFHAYLPAGHNLWQQVAQDALALAQAGFSALWLPPMTKASGGAADVGYSAYDLYDLGEFDQCGSVATKYGDRTQLLQAIASVHNAGLQVYGDVVLHRKHGGDGLELLEGTPVSWRDRNRAMAPAQPIKVHSQFTFPGRASRYSDMTWRGEHFQLVNHNCLAPANTSEKRPLYRLKLKSFSTEIDVRLGAQGQNCEPSDCGTLFSNNASSRSLAGKSALVCELDLEMPAVVKALNEWGQWFLNTTGIDGLRLDGAKHMTASFVRDWVGQLRAGHVTQVPKPDLFIMGDCWSDQVNDLHWYIAKTEGQLSLFDVPLHYNFHRASRQESYYDLRNILKGTLTAEQPALAVTFVDNHNSQPRSLLESTVESWFKPLAYALILLRQEGYPCVFAADYYGAQYSLDDLGAEALSEKEPSKKTYEIELPSHRTILDRLLLARSHYAYGPQQDYFEQFNIIGWTRLGDGDHPRAMAVVISNGHSGEQWMSTGQPNAQFVDMTGHLHNPIWTNDDGWAAFGCPQRSVSVWIQVIADELGKIALDEC
jgi:alpha-amylase